MSIAGAATAKLAIRQTGVAGYFLHKIYFDKIQGGGLSEVVVSGCFFRRLVALPAMNATVAAVIKNNGRREHTPVMSKQIADESAVADNYGS